MITQSHLEPPLLKVTNIYICHITHVIQLYYNVYVMGPYHMLSQIYHILSVISVITIIHYTIYITMLLYIYIYIHRILLSLLSLYKSCITTQVIYHSHITYIGIQFPVIYMSPSSIAIIYIYIQVTICHISHL